MADTQSITLLPKVWTELPDVDNFIITNNTANDVYVKVAAATPTDILFAHPLLPRHSGNKLSAGRNWVMAPQGGELAFTEIEGVGGASGSGSSPVTLQMITDLQALIDALEAEQLVQNAALMTLDLEQDLQDQLIAKNTVLAEQAAEEFLFAFNVQSDNVGTSNATSFTIPSPNSQYQLRWEEIGNNSNNSGGWVQATSANHTIDFGVAGLYKIEIDPLCTSDPAVPSDFDTFRFVNAGDKDKLIDVTQWGSTQWATMNGFAYGAVNLIGPTATDTPDLSGLSNMSLMFYNATNAKPVTGTWDTSTVTNMARMFHNAEAANPDVSNWDTSKVLSMLALFSGTGAANPDVSNWNTSKVTNMQSLFNSASVANPDVSNWDTSSVSLFTAMFQHAVVATPDTSGWDTSSATRMTTMFNGASIANPDTSNWDTSKVTRMDHTFSNTTLANPDVSGWDTSRVTTMEEMFRQAVAANPDVSQWDTSSVTLFNSMFNGAISANPDVSGFDVSNATSIASMFSSATVAAPDVSGWDTGNVTSMANVFFGAVSANPDVSNWNTSQVTNMVNLFRGTPLSNPDVSSWDTSKVTNMVSMFRETALANPDVSSWDTSSLSEMQTMFWQASSADPDLSGWNVEAVTNASTMLSGAAFTTTNYDALLVAWSTQTLQSGVAFHAGNTQYTAATSQAARDVLTNAPNSWVIIDGGGI